MRTTWLLRENHVRSWLLVAAAVLAIAGAGAIAGKGSADDAARVRALEGEVAELRAQVRVLTAERDRARAERNRLEAERAAEAPPAVCPETFLSTADSRLVPAFSIDHPCGWSVLYDPRARPPGEERPGLRAELLLLSRLPISMAPAHRPLADVELADWTDDPADDRDALAPLARWLEEERARFTRLDAEERVEGGGGITITKMRGAARLFGQHTAVRVMLWEYEDALVGARHVVRVVAVAPGARVVEALDRIAASFRVRTRS